jgi:hypothetical protein
MQKKFYWFYLKELLWKLTFLFLGVLCCAIGFYFLPQGIPKTTFGILCFFISIGFIPTFLDLFMLYRFIKKGGKSFFAEIIAGYILIPRLNSQVRKEHNKTIKINKKITIKELELMLENTKEGKQIKQKEIYEQQLLICNDDEKITLKQRIKELEFELAKDDVDKQKISEELLALDEI